VSALSQPRVRRGLETVRAYVGLTKPRIIELLLVTTVPTMIVAAEGVPSLGLVAAVLVGGTLAAGSANAVNCWADRDIDRLMNRTADRPLATEEVPPAHALAFAATLGVAAFAWLSATVNLVAAVLAVAAILFYVFVYTLGLKRRSAQNIVIGGAAGCVPVLVGWAAVTGGVGLPALVLFGIVFVWTPPHFWALALRYRDDYAAAGVPMLPVVAGRAETTRRIFAYAVVLVAVSLVFAAVATVGAVYLVAAVLLGGAFIWQAWRLLRSDSDAAAMRVFHSSIAYLALLFVVMAVDVLVAV
jgi:protoheme IX farnesyltransferase